MTKASGFLGRLFAPVDIASLVVFRISFGLIMMWEVYRYWSKGWIARYYIDPDFNFTYWGFHWVTPWEGDGMYWHFAVMGILAAFMLVGFLYRLSASLFFLAFTYIFLLEKANYLNHFYLVSLLSFLMIWVPAHRAYSVDAWLWPKIRSVTVPVWSVWLLRFQVGIPYFFGGIAKINPDWLRAVPINDWLDPLERLPLVEYIANDAWFPYFMAYSGLFIDLLAVPLLLWGRTRMLMYLILVSFHLLNAYMFSIGIFPWFMILATTIFFEPSWPRFGWKLPKIPVQATQSVSYLIVISLTVWCSVQVLMPLRHWLYPSYVSWSEEGHNFAWHMKLRSKDSEIYFLVVDPVSEEEWWVDPHDYLTHRQARKMSTRPDMILQFAHYLEKLWREEGYEDVQVFAEAEARLNDHRWQTFIDEDVDLSEEDRDLAPDPWILPFKGFD